MNIDDELKDVLQKKWDSYHKKPVFDPENPEVFLHHPTFGVDEIFALTDKLLTTHVTMGKEVKAFEHAYCDALGFGHGVSSNSGSSANLLMVAALCNHFTKNRLYPGDEVIIPAMTWSTSLFPLTQYGLTPVFVDCDPNTLNIDPQKIADAIGPKTKAMMIVPIYGNPCDMDAIMSICQQHDLILIEDSCESMGALYDGKPVGSFGVMSSFSFYYSHHITCLEGGITVTDDYDLAETMRIIRSHGWIRNVDNPQKWQDQYPDIDPKFLFVNEGYNLRITEPQASMGLVQIPKLHGFIAQRRKNAALLLEKLSDFEDILIFQQEGKKATHSWFGFPITIRNHAKFSRDDMRRYLESKNIETRVVVAGSLASQPVIKLYPHRIGSRLEHAEHVMSHSFSLPIHQHLNDEAIEYMAQHVRDFIRQY